MTDEQKLIKKVLNGDQAAFRSLVTMHHQRVIHICLSFVTVHQDAEDIAQEVFVEVYRSIHNYRKEASLSTWLYRLATNKSLDFLRQKKRLKRGAGQVTSVDKLYLEQMQISNRSIPSDELEKQERIQLLHSALELLPDRQRSAIVLSKIDGLSQQEVAGALETSVKSVESLLIRAKRQLKKILEKKRDEVL